MRNEKIMKRDPAMDILRCVACFGVVSVHFLLNNGFYTREVAGAHMAAMVLIRSFFGYCVPLFLMLSGYLMCNKRPEKKYYKKFGKIYFIYVGSVLACIFLFRFLYSSLYQALGIPKIEFAPVQFLVTVKQLLCFSGSYSWYIEMYAGLFLLIPFLNVLYHGLKTQKSKKLLVLTCIALTALPSLINVFYIQNDFSVDPSFTDSRDKIIPEWWTKIYPLTYYFIGSYLREYKPKIKVSVCALLVIISTGASFAFNLLKSSGKKFVSGMWVEWNSLFVLAITVSIFLFFLNLKYDKCPYAVKWCFAKLSDLCLGIYLTSWIFDKLFYPALNARVPSVDERLWYYFLIVPAVFACSAVVSYLILKAYQLCSYLTGRAVNAVKNKRTASTE